MSSSPIYEKSCSYPFHTLRIIILGHHFPFSLHSPLPSSSHTHTPSPLTTPLFSSPTHYNTHTYSVLYSWSAQYILAHTHAHTPFITSYTPSRHNIFFALTSPQHLVISYTARLKTIFIFYKHFIFECYTQGFAWYIQAGCGVVVPVYVCVCVCGWW